MLHQATAENSYRGARDERASARSTESLNLAFLLTFCNAMATVLNEKALKRNSNTDINLQNVTGAGALVSF